jgi:uncharacterized protein with ParB-like and HNH nuclease domain/predicted transport protein
MKASGASLLKVMKDASQFVIPIYQRTYSWTAAECRQLWGDILRVGATESIGGHFVGSVVYVADGIHHQSDLPPLLVIDGQQRLTTVTLIVAALVRALETANTTDDGAARKWRNYYLVNPEETGERNYKLLLSEVDRDTLKAIITSRELPAAHSIRIAENFKLFEDLIGGLGGNLDGLIRGLGKLLIVDVSLERGKDNPQLIFESMNSTGKELSQADLIRNFILMGLEPDVQTRLYEHFWRPMETDFGQKGYVEHFDYFMRHYLTLKNDGNIPNVNAVYAAFKQHTGAPTAERAEAVLRDLRQVSRRYCAMAFAGKEPDAKLAEAFADLRELTVDVAYPLLLDVYADYDAKVLSRDDLLTAVRTIESYVFRRAACEIPTNSMNKTFATIGRSLDKTRYLESLRAQFQLLPTYRRWPDDEEFKRSLKTRDLYRFGSRRSYWLRRLENDGRQERVPVNEYTIEHIMPQNENLSAEWRQALGPEWERVQKVWLHTLGNLTLTGYNSQYSDRPFPEKRDMEGGFKSSPLRLNKGLGDVEQWNEAAIATRAERLARLAVDVWQFPALDKSALSQHLPPKAVAAAYTIADHPRLHSGLPKELYEALRGEVLALDPIMSEHFLKHYVALKAETNLVDVVPQMKQLIVSIIIPFSRVHDPKGKCRDVSGMGRWTNGDVEIPMTSKEDLPYIMGIVRQAFDIQMAAVTP